MAGIKLRKLLQIIRLHKHKHNQVVSLHDDEAGGLATGSGRRPRQPFSLFFSLPPELQTLILCQLTVKSLLTLRLASRAMNAAIVLSGSVILHEYVHSIRPMQVIYYAPPPPGTSSLSYLLDMEHRKNTTRKLSDLLSNLVCEDLVVDGDQEQKRREHQEMHSKLKARLFPVIFTLYHFFEEFRRLLLEHEVARIKETSSTTSSHKSFAIELSGSEIVDQRVLMQRYPPSMVEHLYSAFMLITKVLLKHVAPSQSMFFPSRMDRDGQRRRAREELGIPLVLGGMDKVYDFLKIGISSGPFKPSCPVKTWTNGLYPSPTKNSQWQRNWEKLGITSRGFQVSKVPQLTVRVPNLDRILVHAACDLIIWNALGIDLATWLAANPPIFMPSPRSAGKYVIWMAGSVDEFITDTYPNDAANLDGRDDDAAAA